MVEKKKALEGIGTYFEALASIKESAMAALEVLKDGKVELKEAPVLLRSIADGFNLAADIIENLTGK
jgi:hypothetical protein